MLQFLVEKKKYVSSGALQFTLTNMRGLFKNLMVVIISARRCSWLRRRLFKISKLPS